jgi:S-(hydroxymethyl)glutathione dehydrogenase/alcohol dehydrogenase
MPIVLGHEAAGTIVDVGDGTSRSRIGERVVLSWNPHCGHCFYCDGRGADCVLESAGNERAFRISAEACRAGGSIVWLGKVGIDQDVAFRWGSLMGEKRIIRSSYGGAQTAQDFPFLARLYLEGKLKLDELITRRIALEQIDEGFDDLRMGRAIRTVIVFDGLGDAP